MIIKFFPISKNVWLAVNPMTNSVAGELARYLMSTFRNGKVVLEKTNYNVFSYGLIDEEKSQTTYVSISLTEKEDILQMELLLAPNDTIDLQVTEARVL